MYYNGDDNGPTRPMSHDEMVQAYQAMKPDDLLSLADLHIGFRDLGDVEFLLFKDRLSAAVLMAEVANSTLEKLGADREELRTTGAHRVITEDELQGLTRFVESVAAYRRGETVLVDPRDPLEPS